MTDEHLSTLGRLIDKCENLLFGAQRPLPPPIHMTGLTLGLVEIRDTLRTLYDELGGEDVWSTEDDDESL